MDGRIEGFTEGPIVGALEGERVEGIKQQIDPL